MKAWRTAARTRRSRPRRSASATASTSTPSVKLAKRDGLGALGQFAYYDAAVVHGFTGHAQIRARVLARPRPPAAGGDESAYLSAFLDERRIEMLKEKAHSRAPPAGRPPAAEVPHEGNLELHLPLIWTVNTTPSRS